MLDFTIFAVIWSIYVSNVKILWKNEYISII